MASSGITRASSRSPNTGRDAGEHAGAQLQLAVVDAAADADRAAVGVHQRVDGLDHARCSCGPGSASTSTSAVWPRLDLGLEALGQAEVDEDRVQVLDVHDVGAVLEVVAHVDAADAGDAVERRHDAQPRRGGLGQRQLGLRPPAGWRALSSTARWLMKFCATSSWLRLWLALGDRQFGLRLLHLRQRQLVVQLHQQLAAPHALAVAEVDAASRGR